MHEEKEVTEWIILFAQLVSERGKAKEEDKALRNILSSLVYRANFLVGKKIIL